MTCDNFPFICHALETDPDKNLDILDSKKNECEDEKLILKLKTGSGGKMKNFYVFFGILVSTSVFCSEDKTGPFAKSETMIQLKVPQTTNGNINVEKVIQLKLLSLHEIDLIQKNLHKVCDHWKTLPELSKSLATLSDQLVSKNQTKINTTQYTSAIEQFRIFFYPIGQILVYLLIRGNMPKNATETKRLVDCFKNPIEQKVLLCLIDHINEIFEARDTFECLEDMLLEFQLPQDSKGLLQTTFDLMQKKIERLIHFINGILQVFYLAEQ